MEPDIFWNQVKHLRSALQTSIRQISEKNIKLEDVFVHSEFVLHQIDTLEQAVGDSVRLHRAYGGKRKLLVTDAEFLSKQVDSVQTAVQDYVLLQTCEAGSTMKLSSLAPRFVLQIVQMLEDVVCDNSKLIMELKLDLNTLSMSTPPFATMIVGWLHRVLHCHAILLESVGHHREARIKAETALESRQLGYDDLSKAQSTAQARISELEDTLKDLWDKHRVKEAAEVAAQARIDKILEELRQQMIAQCLTLPQLQEEAVAKAALMEKYQNLSFLYHRQIKVTAENSSRLDAFHEVRAQEQESRVTELQNDLQQHTAALAGLELTNIELRSTVGRIQDELRTTKEELLSSQVECDTWRTTAEGALSRSNVEQTELPNVGGYEQREITGVLLQNAVRKIEELEGRIRAKEEEIANLRAAMVDRGEDNKGPLTPISPPHSRKLSRKRAFPDRPATCQSSSSADTSDILARLVAQASSLSARRTQELEAFADVDVDLGDAGSAPAIFSRTSLSNILGGSCQGLIVKVTNSATQLALHHEVDGFLCPNMDHNPWSPTGPGKHGYMQVGLGRDAAYFNEGGEYRHVFVGTGKCIIYCGYYHALRVEPLTKEEWDTLPAKVKSTYSATTLAKEKSSESKSPVQVEWLYNEGKKRAPCVRLQCLRFDTAFYQELVRANDQFHSNRPRPALATAKAKSSKRRKVSNGAEDDDKGSISDVPLAQVQTARTSASSSASVGASAGHGSDTGRIGSPGCSTSTSAEAGPAESPTSPPPTTGQTPQAVRQQPDGPITLRIPGRWSLRRRAQASKSTSEDEQIVEDDPDPSSLEDDDDLYRTD